jgi:hypothetical protein
MTEAIEARAFEAASRHPRFADLVSITKGVATRAATERSLRWAPLADVLPEADRGTLREEDASTELGNAWTILERGPRTLEESALLRALWAHAVAESRTHSADDEDDLVARVLWLATFTPFDATLLLDRALGQADAEVPFWGALGERLRRIDAGEIEGAGRAEALAAAVALRGSSSAAAAKERARLATKLTDPAVASLLAPEETASPLHGELVAPPRSPVVTVILALTGLLFLTAIARVAARLALGYRRPADVTLTAASVRIHASTLILGRKVRERDIVLARPGLARAIRDVRYPRAAFYAGLFFLALGSLFGVHTFIDGVRAASPSLLFYGVAVVAIGVGLDFGLSIVDRRRAGTCGVIFVNRDGTALSVGGVDAALAEQALGQLSQAATAA